MPRIKAPDKGKNPRVYLISTAPLTAYEYVRVVAES